MSYPKPDKKWIDERVEYLDGRQVIVSVSGGKDSTAVCLLLREAGIQASYVHMDTGHEAKDTEDYVRGYLADLLGGITIIQSEVGGMRDWALKKGMFPSKKSRWCTEKLKVIPMAKHLKALQLAGEDPVTAVGIRHDESKKRAELPEWEEERAFDAETWRPLIHWSFEDVIAIHQHHGVRPNPLYLKGAERVGCYPCIYARKAEVRMIADISPERIDYMRQLEADVTEAQSKRLAKKGETIASRGWANPAWFQNPRNPINPVTGKIIGACMPIDDVVAWSRTAYGGKQTELFAPPYEDGCMRWGMCDQGPAVGPDE